MEVTIGVIYSPKELNIELDGAIDDIASQFEKAVGDGIPMLWLQDVKGRRVGVPADKLAYVEISSEEGEHHVGFGR
ncbi:MAG TPA: DUF3107 domain-containing protein [Acidimicrobiia bacterium]